MSSIHSAKTLKDIASQCGVSTSTVSRVLNNAPGISSKTRAHVFDIVNKNNFSIQKRRRPLARSQLAITIVIPEDTEIAVNPFFDISELISAINSIFAKEHKQIEVVTFSAFRKLVAKSWFQTDGLMLAFGSIDAATKRNLKQCGIPYVFLNRTFEEENCISCNNYKGIIRLGNYLRCKGKSNIGYLGYGLSPINTDRFRGYRTFRAETAHDIDQDLVCQVDSIEDVGLESARFFLDRDCDAVMCFNDNFAIRFIGALQQLGKQVPDDISITGFDNSPMRKLFTPQITTISLSTYEMGFYASRWLRDNILNRNSRRLHLEIEGELLEGQTVK